MRRRAGAILAALLWVAAPARAPAAQDPSARPPGPEGAAKRRVAAPVFAPSPGEDCAPLEVTITTTPGATIYYTTDGSAPARRTSPIYRAPLRLTSTTTVKAFALKRGLTRSAVTAGVYNACLPTLQPVRTVAITTTGEGGSARPEVAATADRVFVLYLGNIQSGGNRTFNLKVYDSDLQNVLASRVLVPTTPQYGGPTDIRVASDNGYVYAFYETNKPSSPTAAVTYLWGAKYRLDDAFDRVAYTAAPVAESKPMAQLADGGELLDDPAPLVGPDSVFVVTRLKYSLATSGRTAYRVREFGKEDLVLRSRFDIDLSAAADGRGRVASLLFWNDRIQMALATTVSDQGLYDEAEDGAKSDIVLVQMRPDWTFDPRTDVRTISAAPDDVENYVSGLAADDDYLYVTYKQSVGRPPNGEHRAWIAMLDGALDPVQAVRVRSTPWGPGGGELRPSLELQGDRLFSGQSAGQSLGAGDAEVVVYQVSR